MDKEDLNSIIDAGVTPDKFIKKYEEKVNPATIFINYCQGVCDYIEKNKGKKILGQGAYATVYKVGKDTALKVEDEGVPVFEQKKIEEYLKNPFKVRLVSNDMQYSVFPFFIIKLQTDVSVKETKKQINAVLNNMDFIGETFPLDTELTEKLNGMNKKTEVIEVKKRPYLIVARSCVPNNCSPKTTEIAIGSFLSRGVEKGECPHFVMVKSFISCASVLTFMELIDKASEDYLGYDTSPDAVLPFVFQTLIGIGYMQKFEISHQDLHAGNVMLKKTPREYFYYKAGSKSYRVPSFGVIVKIADFGLSSKYSEPKLISGEKFPEEYHIPKSYKPYYDVSYFVYAISFYLRNIPDGASDYKLELKELGKFTKGIKFIKSTGRPNLNKGQEKITVLDLFKKDEFFMKDYLYTGKVDKYDCVL